MSTFDDWNSLAHHGILGQKWGVRRYQNYDGSYTAAGYQHRIDVAGTNKLIEKEGIRSQALRDSHTIPKGTVVYRTTTSNSEDSNGSTYVSYLDVDRNWYKGNGWIRAQAGHGSDLYEDSYVLKEDLNVPSRKETVDVINSVMSKNPDLVGKTMKAWADMAIPENSFAWREHLYNVLDGSLPTIHAMDKARKDYVDDLVGQYGKMTVNEAAFYVMQSLGKNKEVRDQVISELSKRGYNAMTDEAGVGGQNSYGREGVDPLIVFDRGESMERQGHQRITSHDESQSLQRRNKAWRKVRDNEWRGRGEWSAIKDNYDTIGSSSFDDWNSLAHHGIKGQKWGIRRFQNPDGSYTEEGKRHKSGEVMFVSGSSKTQDKSSPYYRKKLPKFARKILKSGIKSGDKFIVGDAPGIDRQVQEFLKKKHYDDVEIYGPGQKVRYSADKRWKTNPIDDPDHPEGSKEWLAKKDKAMTDRSTKGLAIILDEGSKATRKNVERLLEQNKHVQIYELYPNRKWDGTPVANKHGRENFDDQELLVYGKYDKTGKFTRGFKGMKHDRNRPGQL